MLGIARQFLLACRILAVYAYSCMLGVVEMREMSRQFLDWVLGTNPGRSLEGIFRAEGSSFIDTTLVISIAISIPSFPVLNRLIVLACTKEVIATKHDCLEVLRKTTVAL